MAEVADLSATELRRLYLPGETRPSGVIALMQGGDAWEPGSKGSPNSWS